ncbi:MAG: A/G-specific adenine glycosylase [Actinomycetota bacterium]
MSGRHLGELRTRLSAWYEPRGAQYPWREEPNPYRVLVSEVMLQQTQAARVVAPYRLFLERFPTIAALAAAPASEVVRAWSGLGYNRRAVSLSRAARLVAAEHGGRLPSSADALRSLPGVGPYTASAVASIAFGERLPAIDVNVRRVVSRAVFGAEPTEVPDVDVAAAAGALLDPVDPGSWNQAIMDLGREACRVTPACRRCPLLGACRSGGRERPAGRASTRPPARFEGSNRQLRGRMIEQLRRHEWCSLGKLANDAAVSLDRARAAVAAMAREGILEAGPAALGGRPGGRVRLAEAGSR